MKKFYTFGIAILAFVVLAGCNDIKEFAEQPLETKIVLTATHEGVSPDTKTLRMDDGSTLWNPKEEISVFYGSGSNGGNKFTSKNTTIAETTEFEGSISSMSGSQDFWAVYPYSSENSCDGSSITTIISHQQTGVEGNFSDDVFPAMGKSSSLTMPFWNICGGIKFYVSRADIKSVTFKGNNGETLAGKVKVAFNADGHPEVAEVIQSQAEVTLTAPDGGTFKAGKYYYLTLLPGALKRGFTMTFATASETGALTSDKPQTVKRSFFGTLKNVDAKVTEWESDVPIPEYVDLGLSVKWATFNLGASKPEDYGDYYAWGEIEQKTNYSWSTYKWCNGSEQKLTKYCTKSSSWDSSAPMDNKNILDPEDDAASANWGGDWRLPTDEDWTELRTNCTWTWTTQNGVNGRLVKAKNGNSIFLPAAGIRDDTSLYNVGSYGCYWSSSLNAGYPNRAWYVDFNSGNVRGNYINRHFGFSIRPVYGEFIPVSSITLDKNSLELVIGNSAKLTATISPSNATLPDIHWVSGDNSIASVDQYGNISALAEGSTTVTAYSSNGLGASCVVTVKKNSPKGWDVFIWHDVTFPNELPATASYTGKSGTARAPRLGVTKVDKDLNVTEDESSMWILRDSEVNMSYESFAANYDLSNPKLILDKRYDNYGKEPGATLPDKDRAVLVSIADINTYYSSSGTGLSLTTSSPTSWQQSVLTVNLKIDKTFIPLNDYDTHYVYVLYPAKDNTKNIDVVIKFSLTVEPHVHDWTILKKYNNNTFWTLNHDYIEGTQDLLIEPKPSADAYYGNEPYATYGAVRFKFADEYDMRTAFVEHFTDNAQCWKNANEESIYVFKIYNYKNNVVDIVDGDASAVKGNESGYATVTISGADLKKMANPASGIMSPFIFVRWPAGLSDGKDILVQVTELCRSVAGTAVNDLRLSDYGKTYVQAYYYVILTDVSKTFEAVDLGLPSGLKWASFNVGATKPEEYGDYFAWGETKPKKDYSWSTYTFELGTDYKGPFSKYVTDPTYGTVDNKTALDPEDDAASANWGGNWRMPTYEEFYELLMNCTWTWTDDYNGTGIAGRVVTASNGNSIFLPAAGSTGHYWSSSINSYYPSFAVYFGFNSDDVYWSDSSRSYGLSVRPVCPKD